MISCPKNTFKYKLLLLIFMGECKKCKKSLDLHINDSDDHDVCWNLS